MHNWFRGGWFNPGKKFCDAGRSVVLIEKGGYYDGEDMNQRDEVMFPLVWKNSGANLTDDLRIAIAQGSCLGGSTIINDVLYALIYPILSEINGGLWGWTFLMRNGIMQYGKYPMLSR